MRPPVTSCRDSQRVAERPAEAGCRSGTVPMVMDDRGSRNDRRRKNRENDGREQHRHSSGRGTAED
jgi:hypothetical protein